MKFEAICSSETSVDFRQTAQRYIPEDIIFTTTALRTSNPTWIFFIVNKSLLFPVKPQSWGPSLIGWPWLLFQHRPIRSHSPYTEAFKTDSSASVKNTGLQMYNVQGIPSVTDLISQLVYAFLQKLNSVAVVRKRTIPTERPPLVGEASAKLLRVEDVAWSGQRILTAVNLGFLDRSHHFFIQVVPQLSSRGWVDPVPDPLPLKKSGRAGNRTWDLWICSQKLWPLDHIGGRCILTLFNSIQLSFIYVQT
jgi:hypothetical protein